MANKNDSISSIICFFNYDGPNSNQFPNGTPVTKPRLYDVVLKNKQDFQRMCEAFSSPDPDNYEKLAGGDLSTVFAPYTTQSGSYLPTFVPGTIHNYTAGQFPTPLTVGSGVPYGRNLLPFPLEDYSAGGQFGTCRTNGVGTFYIGSGSIPLNHMGTLVNGPIYPQNDSYIRYNKDIRGMGFRFPMIGVGWGFTTGGVPFPNTNNNNKIQAASTNYFPRDSEALEAAGSGHLHYGWQMDPKNWVAAPIDFRYDTSRNVWTTGPTPLFPVKTTRVGGSQAVVTHISGIFNTTKTSWTYNVYSMENVLLAENVPQIKKRSYGEYAYQTGDDCIGLAFYGASGIVRLWDANEEELNYICDV